MLIIGYILLVLGFTGLTLTAMSARKNEIAALGHHLGELPQQGTFNRKEVESVIGKASFYGVPGFGAAMVSPLLMLFGGVLLDNAGRRRKIGSAF